jgi:hypothetical protein
MIKDKVFIFDISTSMCRVYKEARKTIEDAILQLQKSDTNRITVVEIGDFWEVVCKQKLPEEFDYKFLPSVATQHSSYFIDYLGPTILSLIEDLEDSDDVEIIIVGDDGANLGHEINFEDIKKICSDLDYKLTTPLSDFDNGYITMQGTTVNIPSNIGS